MRRWRTKRVRRARVADKPTLHFPDGSAMKTRLTAAFRQHTHSWALVHMHVSVGVPDEEVVEAQRRWGTGRG